MVILENKNMSFEDCHLGAEIDNIKLEIYKLARGYIITSDKFFVCICAAVKDATYTLLGVNINISKIHDFFPEIKRYKPADAIFTLHWWALDEDGKRIRIDVLNNIIKELGEE